MFVGEISTEKFCEFCQCSECVCKDCTDSSSNKLQLQGTIIILINFFHIQFCVVAWGIEDMNEIKFCLIFSIFCL